MAETKSAVNRVWASIDTGSTNFGPKISAFFGGDTVAEVNNHIAEMFGTEAADLMIGKLYEVAVAEKAMEAAVSNVQSAGMVGGNAPAAPTNAPVCNHGAMQYKESKPGAAKAWKAWFCPAQKGDPTQCKAKFL